ncbi:uncharacterized protein LOC129951943 [Eupeodes corollae]|uniref:uncharacterized protein LOC129951943 n=1 Tax=Eupeodes corollae TaxID=290404 RepID=UPI0024902AC4|nr:uncharacterized protein LOC129951943 [Eupeodes corollae]
MIHGSCGTINRQSPCMVDGKCSKRYPRKLTAETITGNDGYPLYRRRLHHDNGRTITTKVKGNVFVVDNSWIVPYSPLLSTTFKAHCNVEYCNSVKSIKYICKYVTKGSDMAVFENGQIVYFTASNAAQRAETPPATTLTNFFAICQSDPFARTLLYSEMPRYYTWNATSKKIQRRKQGDAVPALGCIYTVHPKNDECFYLRLLLVHVRGPTSFESLRTVNGIVCPTFRAACQELNLLENDTHWDTTIAEAIISASPSQIRTLFAIIISTCFPSNPLDLWNKYKDNMSEDILHRIRTLLFIEDTYVLPHVPQFVMLYDPNELIQSVQTNVPLLNLKQREVYDTLINAINDGNGGLFFLDAPGGTGKTFLMSLILATAELHDNKSSSSQVEEISSATSSKKIPEVNQKARDRALIMKLQQLKL